MNSFRKSHHTVGAHENRLRDIILGGQDGLVNVLGIVLGVSAASDSTGVLIAAALSAAFAEAISMGAVAYTSEVSEHDRYLKEREREKQDILNHPEEERAEIRRIYSQKGFSGEILDQIVEKITSNERVWVNTVMEEELKISDISKSTIMLSSIVVGCASLLGSLVPVLPFIFLTEKNAAIVAVGLSAVTLFAIGAYEAKSFIGSWWKNGLRIMLIGMGAAFVGYLIGLIFGSLG